MEVLQEFAKEGNKMSRIDGYSSYAQAGGLYDKNPLRKTKTEKSPKSSDKVGEAPKLSEREKKLLEELYLIQQQGKEFI